MIISNILWISQLFVFFKVFSTYSSAKFYNIFIAIIFSVLATFAYGNGLVSFLVGGLVLALGHRWRDLAVVLGAFVLTMLVYALTRSHASPPPVDLTQLQNYWLMLTCFLGFLGSTVSVDAYQVSPVAMWGSVVWGAVLLGGILWAIFAKTSFKFSKTTTLNQQQLFVVYLVVFVCITAAGVVYKRAESDQLLGMFKGRYRMYPVWLLVAVYGWLLTTQWSLKKWFLPTAICLSMLFNGLVLYYSVANAVNNRRMAVAQEFNSMYNADLLGLRMFDLTGEDFKRLQNLYRPTLFFEGLDLAKIRLTQTIALDSVYFNGDVFTVQYDKDFVRPLQDFDDGAYVFLHSPAHTYMSAGTQRALPLKTFVRRGWYWDRGFSASIHRASVAAGTYQLYVLIRQNGKNQWYQTGKEIQF
ncbi:MAG: hypothetical protein MUE30_18410 [Spirosomaceae bacterium]|nr:hypothetical protein [Spirosomataceae bacterium]